MEIITVNNDKRYFVLSKINKSIFDENGKWTEESNKKFSDYLNRGVFIIENQGVLYSCYEIIDAEIKQDLKLQENESAENK